MGKSWGQPGEIRKLGAEPWGQRGESRNSACPRPFACPRSFACPRHLPVPDICPPVTCPMLCPDCSEPGPSFENRSLVTRYASIYAKLPVTSGRLPGHHESPLRPLPVPGSATSFACPLWAVALGVAWGRVRAAKMGSFGVGKKWWIGSTCGIVARYARSASGCTTVGIIV